MQNKWFIRSALLFALACLALCAQSDLGTITGFVKDPTGATIPNATVSVRNEATGSERKATTNEAGSFTVTNIPAGFYTIDVEAAGFKKFQSAHNKLDPSATLSLDAPLTVDNFSMLARKGYFNGQTVPRVVPNFVIQTGDPRGDQNGGPGYSIRCEINEAPYDRGAVGMALSGKDTGGSQWFVTHSPQPHLDGGYTVFGHVVAGMDVVDKIVRGDIIRSVTISEGPQRASKSAGPGRRAHQSGNRE